MEFSLASPRLAQEFAAGDRVRVGVRESDDGLVVERLEKIGGAP
jgi:Cu(I)/Ag(I) efflux system membrane fusion protein